MNRSLYRLVFSAARGMRVAVPEHASANAKAGGGRGNEARTRARAVDRVLASASAASGVALLALLPLAASAQTSRPPVVFASKLPAALAPQPVLPIRYGNNPTNATTPRAFVYNPAAGQGIQDPSTKIFSGDLQASGAVSWTPGADGKSMVFDQGSQARVVINWDSFDIGAGYSVRFKQDKDPAKYVSALNRIWNADPSIFMGSVIFGSLTADREVILVNANGVYFGRGARVDTGKFVATANSIADAVFEKGLRNVTDGSAVFSTAGIDYVPTSVVDDDKSRSAAITVEPGAQIRTAAGGDVLLIAPRVVNQGRIVTPGGQTILAAGDKVYLMSSSDPAQRGLIVAVDPLPNTGLNTVENAATGSFKTVGGATVDDTTPDNTAGLARKLNEIRAESGTVNLVGLSVRQSGVINATTAVKGANGAIYLQAMGSTATLLQGDASVSGRSGARGLTIETGAQVRVGATLGTVDIAAGSQTVVSPATTGATELDAEQFNASRIRIEGKSITVGSGAVVKAPAGKIELLAAENSIGSAVFDATVTTLATQPDASRIVVAPDAVISAAGLTNVAVDGARNQGTLRLFRIELADAPVQRSGPLYRSQVYFDLRDGSKIKAANVTGAAAAITRTAEERSTAGGSLRIEGEGAVVLGERAVLDVSGGSVNYSAAILKNSVVERDGLLMAFKSAAADQALDRLLANPQSTPSPAYVEGRDGGSLSIAARTLALDAQPQGSVLLGDRQRDGTSARAVPASLTVGRIVAGQYLAPAMSLEPANPPAVDAALFADPLNAPLTALAPALAVSLPKVAGGGFGRLALRALALSQTSFGELNLGLGGSLDVQSAGALSLNGAFATAGGSIALQGLGDTELSPGTRLSTAGRWTNDLIGAGGAAERAASPVQLNGGSISVVSGQGALTLRAGAALDASAGAWLNASGGLKQGTAGSIRLGAGKLLPADPGNGFTLAGVGLSAYDFGAGGALSLSVQDLTVAANPGLAPAGGFVLDPGFFGRGGFGSVSVSADGDVRVASGARVAPLLLNWQLAPTYRTAVSGGITAIVVTPAVLDTQLFDRKPISLALSAARKLDVFGGADVVVERGASIEVDPGGKIALSSTRNLEVGASGGAASQTSELTARGGSIALTIVGTRGDDNSSGSGDNTGFLGDQVLWLGDGARLSVSGVPVLRPLSGALASTLSLGGAATAAVSRAGGTVLGGGSITLNAQRGYVVATQGSSMTLDGKTAAVNYAGVAQPVQISKSAGTLSVSSAEGFALDGIVSAQAPVNGAGTALADGGQFVAKLALSGNQTATLGPRQYLDDPATYGSAFKPRRLMVGAYDNWVAQHGLELGKDLSTANKLDNGLGYVRTSMLTSGGFSGLSLGGGDTVVFNGSFKLDLPLGLRIDAPAVSATPGSKVELDAGYAQLGDIAGFRNGRRDPGRSASSDTSPKADTSLAISASSFDLYGSWALQGFSLVQLAAGRSAQDEIRLMTTFAVPDNFGTPVTNTLSFAGRLELTASQVYSVSGTRSALSGLAATGLADAGSTLVVGTGSAGAATLAPLSAFGALSAAATRIEQRGVLRQPFGSISLTAERTLLLGEGSLTSVSGNGAIVPYGSTRNLALWSGNFETDGLPLGKGISLTAQQVQTSASAVVSAGGGGTVQAYEFFPGVGGSKDYFETVGLYALLPEYRGTQAIGSETGKLVESQRGVEFVVTTAGGPVSAGRYTLMPARYALLSGSLPSGAYLVSRAADQGKTLLAQALRQDDGSTVVNGYITQAGSIAVGAPNERFVIEPPATFQAKSDIRLTDVSTLLATRANTLGASTAPALPRDAGPIQLQVGGTDRGTWNAALDLAGRGGLAGTLDISATQLALVDDLAKTPAGTLGVSAGVIGASGAGSVLLGGKRSLASASADPTTPTWNIDQSGTNTVSIDLGSSRLQAEELLLAAKDDVLLAAGTRIGTLASGTLGARTLASVGDGALAAFSSNALGVQRSGVAFSTGRVLVGANALLGGTSVNLDASTLLQLSDSTGFQTPSLGLGARRIVVGGDASSGSDATVLSGALLAAVQATPDISLRSYQSIDFMGAQNWAQRPAATAAAPDPAPARVGTRLVLDTPLVRGLVAADGTSAAVDIAAQAIVVRNTTGAAGSGTGAGLLRLQAMPPVRYGDTGGLTLGPGGVGLAFDSVALRSGGDIVMRGIGSTSAQKDLTLSAARVTATSAATQAVTAGGTLLIATEAGSRTLGEPAGQGADIKLSATTLRQNGVLDLPGGTLAVAASGADSSSAAVSFGVGSRTSVAGFVVSRTDSFDAYGLPGSMSVVAGLGRIDVLGSLDVSASVAGNAGQLSLSAAGTGGQILLSQAQADGSLAQGSLQARAGSSADLGGRLLVDVTSMPSLDALATAAAAGGFTREQNVRARTGDVALNRDMLAQRLTLSADAGALAIGAVGLNAAAAAGGVVQLASANDLTLASGARIDARSSRSGANGGDVLLASTSGRLKLASGAVIDASGDNAADGRIVLRAQRGSSNTSVNVDALNSSNLIAGEVDVEAVRRYTGFTAINTGTTSGTTLGQTTVNNDSTTFMTAKSSVLTALGVSTAESSSGRVSLRAGVDVASSGNLALSTDWLFNAARPGGDAGFLTLRASGNLSFTSGSLSDGFVTTANAASAANTGVVLGSGTNYAHAWSFRLAAGADLSAANPLAVKDFGTATTETAGNVTIGAGRLVRTGAGSIEIAAGRDIVFSASTGTATAQGLSYVAGRPSSEQATVLTDLFAGQSAKPSFTEQGGRLELNAVRDISSAEATQLVNNWLWRSGTVSGANYGTTSQFAWWTQFDRIRQTVGSFGGGNLTVNAGRDITNLQAMVPTQAWADSKVRATATLQVRNGGDLTVTAGRDILGGQFLLGRGVGLLRAERDIAQASSNARTKSSLLGLMDGGWEVSSRRDLAIGSVFDPTAVQVPSTFAVSPGSNDNRTFASSYAYSWGRTASLSLNSAAGKVGLYADLATATAAQTYGLVAPSGTTVGSFFQVLPPTLSITAAGGDLELFRSGAAGALLFPSSQGALSVWAAGDLALQQSLVMADTAASRWPSFTNPLVLATAGTLAGAGTTGLIGATLGLALDGASLHAADAVPARVHAEGSIASPLAGTVRLALPLVAEVTAGEDITNLRFFGQNLNAGNTTVVRAGRNLQAGTAGDIELAGPGLLNVSAGRQFDLESSAGIATTGNLNNANLPAQGAAVKLSAATAGTLDVAAFTTQYLSDAGGNARAAGYRSQLLAYVQEQLKQTGLSDDQALAYFKAFPAAAQAAFGRQVLAAEFGATYLSATPPTAAQMTDTLRLAFERHKAEVLKAGDDALAAGKSLTLPGREVLAGAELGAYLADIRALAFTGIDIDAAVAARVASLAQMASGWRDAVAVSFGTTAALLDAAAQQNPLSAQAQAWKAALQNFSGSRFEAYRSQVLASEVGSTGAAASDYGRKTLPMRLALFDQGFQAAELAGAGSFVEQPLWSGNTTVFAYTGSLDMTQSSVVTERGGGISLVNAGGPINVGLKDNTSGTTLAKGVIALGGGDVFGFAKSDFQVNNQRVFVVGKGNMTIWSSSGDIDSGRGANTAVAAPPLAARRSVDGVVFEVPATTTGSGLGILEDATGQRAGTIGLYPALGEILALDAFIRAPTVVLGSTIKGADNLIASSVGGAAAPVSAPNLSLSAPTQNTEQRTVGNTPGGPSTEPRQRSSLLTVDLLGLGEPPEDEACTEQDERDKKCRRPKCTDQRKAAGQCK